MNEVTWRLSVDSWVGQPIRNLAYLDAVAHLFEAVSRADRLSLRLLRSGMEVVELPSEVPGDFVEFSALVDVIRQARDIAEHYGLHTLFTPEFDVGEVEALHWMLFDGTVRPQPELLLKFPPSRIKRELLDHERTKLHKHRIRQSAQDVSFDFFGEPVRVGAVTFGYDNVALHSLERLVESPDILPGEIPAEFRATDDTRVVLIEHVPCL